jgi:hypothetical protein
VPEGFPVAGGAHGEGEEWIHVVRQEPNKLRLSVSLR